MRITTFLVLLLLCSYCYAQKTNQIEPPKALKEAKITYVHSDTLKDDYFWIRNKDDFRAINYLSEENGYKDRIMRDTKLFQHQLFRELKSRLKENEQTIPVKIDNYYYYSRSVRGKDYSIYCRRKNSMKEDEEILLDMNELAKDFKYISLAGLTTSPDHNHLAYSIDYTGGGKSSMFFKDLQTGKVTSDSIHRVASFVWANDNKTLFYTTRDSTNRINKLFRHEKGSNAQLDELIYHALDSTDNINIYKTNSKKYLFYYLNSSVNESLEFFFTEANKPKKKWKQFWKKQQGLSYSIDHYGTEPFFYISYNDFNDELQRNGSLLKVPEDDWKEENISNVIAADPQKQLNGSMVFKNYLVSSYKIKGIPVFEVVDRRSNESYLIEFNEPYYQIGMTGNPKYENNFFAYDYSSLKTPSSRIVYNFGSRKHQIIRKDKIKGYNPDDYSTERIFATAEDGTKIPISLVYKKGLTLDGSNPLILNGYGSYGISNDQGFSASAISLLDRGFIYALAHVRGGGDLGRKWYTEGKLLKKKNTFTDFISCSEHLINERYTNSSKLCIQGASAGGLLMGAVMNMRPDLFNTVIASVPFLDVINTMLDASIPLTTNEYNEWGNPNSRVFYDYMKSYSPYDNIKRQDYPHLLLQGGLNDLNVGFWEPAKFTAKLRDMKTDGNMLLLNTSMSGGHSMVSGRHNYLRQTAFEYAFIFKSMGIESDYGMINGIVYDHEGEKMPYVNVYLKGEDQVATTNSEGEFSIETKKGDHQLMLSHVGYDTKEIPFTLSQDTLMRIEMKTEVLFLKTFTISDRYKDPAYPMIKGAIANRKEHLEEIKSLSYKAYLRMNRRLIDVPDKLPPFIPKEDIPDSTDLGLMYLSESVFEVHRDQPEKLKETMISSRIAGYSDGYSFGSATSDEMTFYENIIDSYYAERGLVSPIAQNALLFYHYKYEGEKREDGNVINKIKVIPRRKNDPVFQGHIYLSEDDYSITGADLILTGRQIEEYDTLYIQQNYAKVGEYWLPILNKTYAHIRIFGFEGALTETRAFNDYVVNPAFPKGFFGNKVFEIETGSNKRDTVYWNESRPVKLSLDEKKYYLKKDSAELAKNSPAYLDSVNRALNKFKIGSVLGGYRYSNESKGLYITTSGILGALSFNTVEGFVAKFDFSLFKGKSFFSPGKREFKTDFTLRYGFSDQKFRYKGNYTKYLSSNKKQSLTLSGGSYIFQYHENPSLSPIVNSVYSLFFEDNYAKFYERNFVGVIYKHKIINGLYFTGETNYTSNKTLNNTTDFSFRKTNEENPSGYTSNNPLNPAIDGLSTFDPYQSLQVEMELKFVPNEKFYDSPWGTYGTGSKQPVTTINYKKGVLDSNFDFLSISVYDKFSLGLWGKPEYSFALGTFLNREAVFFPDFKHFTASQTIILNEVSNLLAFQLLDYYSLSTTDRYFEGHIEHHFNGFLLNKIPLLRRLGFQAVSGLNFLNTKQANHFEFFVGIENILGEGRIDFVGGYDLNNQFVSGVRVNLGI